MNEARLNKTEAIRGVITLFWPALSAAYLLFDIRIDRDDEATKNAYIPMK